MKIGELCEVVRGSSPRPQGDPKYFGGNIPRLMIADITRDGKIVTPRIDSLTEEGAKRSRPMKKGDVVIAVSGDPGRPCILAVDACIHDGFVGLRYLDETKILKTYLFCFLNYFKLSNKKNAVGAIFQNLTTDQIKKIEIPKISIHEQNLIVEILTQAENLISQRKESIALLDELFKSSFLEMFGDPVRNEKGWEKMNISQIGKDEKRAIKSGPFGSQLLISELIPDGIPVYGIDNVQKNKFVKAKPKFISEQKFNDLFAFKIDSEDVLITRTGTVGRTCLAPKNIDKCIIGPNLLKISLNHDIALPIFISSLFNYCNSIVDKIKELSPGATVAVFNTTNLKALEFGIPPIVLQSQFSNLFEKVEALKSDYQASLQELENMYGVLSQKAFKGELGLKEK